LSSVVPDAKARKMSNPRSRDRLETVDVSRLRDGALLVLISASLMKRQGYRYLWWCAEFCGRVARTFTVPLSISGQMPG
jgi:hypothetical protein